MHSPLVRMPHRVGGAGIAPKLLILCVLIYAAGGIGPNSILALFSVAILGIGLSLLWRPTDMPILPLIFVYQWLQASIAIFHANWLGIDIADYSPVSAELEKATILTLSGLSFLALGVRIGAGAFRHDKVVGLRQAVLSRPLYFWAQLYIYALCAATVAGLIGSYMPGILQVMLGVVALKWAFFFIFAYAQSSSEGRGSWMFPAAFLFELAQGIGGFFSDFKTVILVTIAAALAAGVRLTPRRIFGLCLLAVLLLVLAVTWQTIKGDYRASARSGEASQDVTLDFLGRVSKLVELTSELNAERLEVGADGLLRRLSYVEFFGAVITQVPAYVAHTNGEIWLDALVRPFTPRFLFPEKTAIDDTQRTNKFTGGLAGDSAATSISLGYIAEAYIDFGTFWMIIPIAIYGYVIGRIASFFITWKKSSGLLGVGIATAALLTAAYLESSITKIIGGLAAQIIAAVIVVTWSQRWFLARSRERLGSDMR